MPVKGLSATRCVYYEELFWGLTNILEPQVWQAAYDDKERCNTYVVPITQKKVLMVQQ